MKVVFTVETDDESTDPEEIATAINQWIVSETEAGAWSIRVFVEKPDPENGE